MSNRKRKLDEEVCDSNKPKTKSSFFRSVTKSDSDNKASNSNIAMEFLSIASTMNKALTNIKFGPPVECVYNPTEYALFTYSMYINRFCSNTKELLFLGMNPGPWGMVQTGIPFGEVNAVRDWFEITGPVERPNEELPERPVDGFECTKSEISGKRFWNLFKDLCKTPEHFFKHAIMYNYCPLALMKKGGVNVTPPEVKGPALVELKNICNEALCNTIKLFQIKTIIGIGRFAEKQALSVIKDFSLENINVIFMPHPSPRAVGNENWPEKATKFLEENNLMHYFKHE